MPVGPHLVKLNSRLPQIISSLPLRAGAVIHDGAERIAHTAAERVPVHELAPHIRDSLEAEKFGPQASKIKAHYWWYFLEYGTKHMAPRPFVRDSVQAEYPGILAEMRAALRSL